MVGRFWESKVDGRAECLLDACLSGVLSDPFAILFLGLNGCFERVYFLVWDPLGVRRGRDGTKRANLGTMNSLRLLSLGEVAVV